RTEDLRIGGGKGYPSDVNRWINDLSAQTGLRAERVATLLSRYGTRAAEMARALRDETPLTTIEDYSAAEIGWLVDNERVLQLDDLLLRRTTIALEGRATLPLLEELAAVVAERLGWTPDEAARQVERTASILRERHGVNLL